MFTLASCARLRRQPNAMDWENKNDINNTQKQHRRLQTPFSQRTENRDKDKQSAEDSKGTSKYTFLMMIKAIFFCGGRFTQVIPSLTHSYPTSRVCSFFTSLKVCLLELPIARVCDLIQPARRLWSEWCRSWSVVRMVLGYEKLT